MEQHVQLEKIKKYVYELFANDPTGHDFFHMKRVARLAKEIAIQENANEFICEAAAWLHDVGDPKLFTNKNKAREELVTFLQSIGLTSEQIEEIGKAMEDVSFTKGNIPVTLEGKIVQDADRIDAIGAIGIARTFAYGGANGQLIYHDNEPDNTSVQHFYDKLFKLKDLINTSSAKQIAEERQHILVEYVNQFMNEW
ncbi:HD domain-containing protein [Ornithinibacillus sp. L9]|uniref:HD domain-containing protein n=1 Tax=Ornithinibacillus caprae TaxID=2678566 RepID=A0A6N8FCP6_9BACI|nr:HD domain-containing protein [Ornithinibacillus caprae]MUK87313.1 HD domain-containing protein [Ornithinibacillus caprae]